MKDIVKLLARTAEVSRLALCSDDKVIEIAGQVLRPDRATAYVEMRLSHSFPVVTVDNTTLHPQVVANSYRTMLHKVFDLNHLMRAYDPKNNPRDRILGTIVAVEFPESADRWTVQGDKAAAPGIRAVAVMHRNAESVSQILSSHFTGEIDWSVSMEQLWDYESSGFLVCDGRHDLKTTPRRGWEETTPQDLWEQGWAYIPTDQAPPDLAECFDQKGAKVIKKWNGVETLMMFGGLDGAIHFIGVGLTPLGKEKEAEVSLMLAGKKMIDMEGTLFPDVAGLLGEMVAPLNNHGKHGTHGT